jgi:hypothetical protein
VALDDRLDLNKYISFGQPKEQIKTTFGSQYQSNADQGIGGQYPWDPGRFNAVDILNRAQARKRTLNPQLGYVDPEAPQDVQLFIGLGRFVRHEDYNFDNGTPNVSHRPQDNPDYNPIWLSAYKISPTIPPGKRAKNPMPTRSNPDPHGYIMQMSESQAKQDVEGQPDVAQLLSKSKEPDTVKEFEKTV